MPSLKMAASGQKRTVVPVRPIRRVADDSESILVLATVLERHRVTLAITIDLYFEAHAEGVHDRDTHAVKAAGHLVAVTAELAAGVQHREHDFGGAQVFVLMVHADRDSAAIVSDLAPAVGEQFDLDSAAVPSHGLIDRVVDHLVDEVVQARSARWNRCTCQGASAPLRDPRGPGCPRPRRSQPSVTRGDLSVFVWVVVAADDEGVENRAPKRGGFLCCFV